ncbi:MAG TPA: acyl-[ACP]--phospholipid O-acyltransferase, partial [Terriglobales bacterium]|nr:acyl-[ACP]--phospholipid O-acyltransferase [Terriglobales bacterium]
MASGKYSETLKQTGFLAFFCTQFLGAFNDNFLKIIVSFVALNLATSASSSYVELIAFLFILPSALFSGYAGHLADVYSKRTILVAVKVFEIFIMVLAVAAFFTGHIQSMLAIVFLMGLHAAFFSPAKYGILPEMLPDKDLSRGNGLLEMSTFMAIILGTSLGGALFAAWKHNLPLIGVIMIALAVLGTLTSLGIPQVRASGAAKLFRVNPFGEIFAGLSRLRDERTLWLTVIGISYFWFLGALVQINILFFGKELLQLDEFHIGLLGTFLAIGIGAGSLAAGRLSGDHIELGLVPLGSLAIGVCLGLVALAAPSYPLTASALVLLGFSAGLFAVPLNAVLQQRAGREEKGLLIATNNFMNTIGIFCAAAIHWWLKTPLQLSADTIILLIGLLTVIATLVILYLLPDYFVRFVLWLFTHTVYRIRIVGEENIPLYGPALLISNHVSFVDAFLIGASLPRFVHFMLHRDYYDLQSLNWFFRLMRAIPVSASNRREIVESIKRARNELNKGHVVCIFAEGAICRTGRLLPFKRGFEKIVEGTNVPIIPLHLDQLWGSIFSFKGGRFFWKRPERVFYPVTVSFGPALPPTATVQQVRNAVLELESEATKYRPSGRELLHTQFVRTAKRRWRSFCMGDTSGTELTYGKTLIGSLLFSRWVTHHCADQTMIGVLLPSSVGGSLVNIAILLARKIPVNLNFTAGADSMASAVAQCQIRTIVTSSLFLSKGNIREMPGMVFVEEIRKSYTGVQKFMTAMKTLLLPAWWLARHYRKRQRPSDLATVIFSSGSTGAPKGVMLSHHNIIANVESISQVIQFTPKDRIMGVLPLFHSFGFTGTLWLPLLTGFGVVYHPNPTDAKTIGETIQKYQATLFISTSTFYAGYLKRCTKEEFASLRYVIAGAEKLREPVAKGYLEKYGITVLEGYGCTELSPVVSVNMPDVIDGKEKQLGYKPGTVGQPMPGVLVKVIDPGTEQPLPAGEEGLLLIKGPNLMMGYLNQSEATAQALHNGWYVTGDVAAVDEDGFIRITDRLTRFSKIGGEMVPHVRIEEVINAVLGSSAAVVTAVPDEQRGEKLVAFYSQNGMSKEELWNRLNQSDLPKLWIPKRENLHPIDSLPLLGSGKVDLKKIKTMA